MANKPNTTAAKALGAIAFAKGMPSSPALNQEMKNMLAGRNIGDKRTVPEMKAYISGWTQACLSASPV